MKTTVCNFALLSGLLISQLCVAQAPAGAPAGSTGLCNDGTYATTSSKSGACRGHKGVKSWFAASAAAPAKKSAPMAKPATPPAAAPAAKPAPTPAPAAAPAPKAAAAPAPAPASKPTPATNANMPAPGGGPGMVWLNASTNVYHCPGAQYYGKTKSGSYMTEDQAKAKGAHPEHGKPCNLH